MALTLLQLVATTQAELGLFPVATTVVGNTDNGVQQMLALANALGRSLASERSWTAQQRTAIINPVAPIVMTGDMTAGSATITNLSSTASLAPAYWLATGAGIPSAARVQSIGSATSLSLDSQATTTATGVSITFSKDRYDLPSDFLNIINDTEWDRTNHWRLAGPMSPQEDEWVRSGIVTTGPRRRIRITSVYGGASATQNRVMQIWPAPATTDGASTLSYEYMSTSWVRFISAGVAFIKGTFTVDTDVCIFPNALMVAGLKRRFWSIKGFDTTDLENEYQLERQKAISQDAGAQVLGMGRRRSPMFVSPGNIQDGNFPGP